MSQEQIDYRAVRKRVEEGVKRQKQLTKIIFFVVSLCMLILFGFIGWGIAASEGILNNDDAAGALVMLTMGGAMSVLFQFIALTLDSKMGEASIRERLTARELGEEMLRLGMEEDFQQKRKRAMRLAEDGELEEIVEEEPVDSSLEDEPRASRSTK
jgi:hypothetical protein